MYFMDIPRDNPRFSFGKDSPNAQWLRDFTKTFQLQGESAPKAIVVVSAHWVTQGKVVGISYQAQHTKLLYDYGGFPPETYKLQYNPPGSLAVSERIASLLNAAGIQSKLDPKWNFDHGVFIPLKLMFPEQKIPVIEISIDASWDPAWHVKVGEALQPLKNEGVLVLASGSSTHNFSPAAKDNQRFVAGLKQVLEAPKEGSDDKAFAERTRLAALEWDRLPSARSAHPQEDHFVPLFVALGAAGKQVATVVGESKPTDDWAVASVLFETKQ
jgi:aromatic ring-opening dioxygenase catalytic subunit (LigB family)